MKTGQPQVSQHLAAMHGFEPLHALDFDDDMVGDDEIGTMLTEEFACRTCSVVRG